MARVRIAHPTVADEADFLAMTTGSREHHSPWAHPPLDSAGYRELLVRDGRDDTEAFLARDRENGTVVGVLVLSQIFRAGFQNAYLGYYGSGRHAGQGYMSEAIGLVLDEAFGPLALHRVEANIQPGNEASLALVRRAGFRREGFSPHYLKIGGRWRDHERWAILAEEWRGLRPSRSARG